MKKIKDIKIRAKFIFVLLLVSIIPLSIMSYIGIRMLDKQLIDDAYDRLQAVHEVKKSQINDYLLGRVDDAELLAHSSDVKQVLQRAIDYYEKSNCKDDESLDVSTSAYNKFFNENSSFLRDFSDIYNYHDVLIMDANHGHVLFSVAREEDLGTSLVHGPYKDTVLAKLWHKVVETGKVTVQDYEPYAPSDGKPTGFFGAPIVSNGKVVGVVAFQISLDEIDRFMQERVGMGETGETLLVGKDNRMRSSSFLSPETHSVEASFRGTVSQNGIESDSTKKTFDGKLGVEQVIDHRGIPVLEAFSPITLPGGVTWCMLTKIDLAEVTAPKIEFMKTTALIVVVIIVVVLLVAVFIAMILASPITIVTHAAQKLADGDLGVVVDIDQDDEIGALAVAFNQMARKLQLREQVREGSLAISSLLASSNSLQPLLKGALDVLMETAGAQVGAVYLSKETGGLEKVICDGTSKENKLAETVEIGCGMIGRAATKSELQVVDDIAEDTRFIISTVAGECVPKCLINMPLILQNELVGIVSLATLNSVTTEQLEILEGSRLHLATSIVNALANQKTDALAIDLQANNEKLVGMNEELEAQTEELHQQSEELRQQTEELQEQTAELEEQRKAVEVADRLKSEFLSNMSHELRTPLNSVMALSQLMLSQGKDRLQSSDLEYLGVIERNGRHLLNLINDILDLSKIEAGRMELDLCEFPANEVIKRAIDITGPLADKKDIKIKVEADDLPKMNSDEGRVCQILLNLMSNAVKFTDEGEVLLKAKVDGDRILFSVHDTGSGISAQDQLHIFDEFRQADGSTTRRHEGTGLGLAICQRLAGLLGGSIKVESTLGVGSVFTLELPCICPEDELVFADSTVVEDEPITHVTTVEPNGRTILVIDDTPAVRDLLKKYLISCGYDVVIAPNGSKGIELARKIKPDAITLDIVMPEMDGWEVMSRLKQYHETADIPVIIVSVSSDHATGTALGASGFITKPINKNLLIHELEKTSTIKNVKNVLVIDDDIVCQQQMKEMLSENYDKVEAVSNGAEGLEYIRVQKPDLVILDLMMPEMDGFTVLEKLRRDPETTKLPVIVVSAKDLTSAEKYQLRQSALRVITKGSFTKKRLLEEIEDSLKSVEVALKVRNENRKSILLVEPNDIVAQHVTVALEDSGFKVVIAVNGVDALAEVERERPDVVIVEMALPDMTGSELLDKLNDLSLPIMILADKKTTEAESKKAGVSVQKGSLDRETLVNAIKELISPSSEVKTTLMKPPVGSGKILVVEDIPDNVITIGALLSSMGLEFDVAVDGRQGVEMAQKLNPSLILMDMNLPILSGMDAARELKADPRYTHIPIIAVTAKAMKGDREKIIGAGCDDYLSKPINAEALYSTVTKWIKQNA